MPGNCASVIDQNAEMFEICIVLKTSGEEHINVIGVPQNRTFILIHRCTENALWRPHGYLEFQESAGL